MIVSSIMNSLIHLRRQFIFYFEHGLITDMKITSYSEFDCRHKDLLLTL